MQANQLSQQDLRSGASFRGDRYATAKIIASTAAAAAGRYKKNKKQKGNKMTFIRKKPSETEKCVKCGIINETGLTWKRSRTALGERPLLCSNCAKALSKDIKKFIDNWLKA